MMDMNTPYIYSREPLTYHNGIPIFSQGDSYTKNYEQISADHLMALRDTGENPFIPEYLWKQTEESTVELIKKYAKPNATILDVGVGLGRLMSNFPSMRRYGMDISFGYLEQASASGINVCYSLVEDMPYEAEAFDIVTCTDVLEHVLDLNLCCNKILRVLKKGGKLIVRVPLEEDLSGYLSPTLSYEYIHLRRFDEASLKLLFEKILGCKVIDSSSAGYSAGSTKLKWSVPFPAGRKIVTLGFHILHNISSRLYHMLVPVFYKPTEINIVVEKPF